MKCQKITNGQTFLEGGLYFSGRPLQNRPGGFLSGAGAVGGTCITTAQLDSGLPRAPGSWGWRMPSGARASVAPLLEDREQPVQAAPLAVLGAAPCCGSGKGSPAWEEKLQEGGLPFVRCLMACLGPSALFEKSPSPPEAC